MIQRSIRCIFRFTQLQFQATKIPIRQIYIPQYHFFFNNKSEKQRILEQIDLLKDQINENDDLHHQSETLTQIIKLRKSLDIEGKICYEQLSDQIDLIGIQIQINALEDEELVELINDDTIWDRLSPHNLNLDDFPKGYVNYFKFYLKRQFLPIKFEFKWDMYDEDQIKILLDDYNQSIYETFFYEQKNFEELKDELFDEILVKACYHHNKALYHNYKYKYENELQDQIKELEESLIQTEKALKEYAAYLKICDDDEGEKWTQFENQKAIDLYIELLQLMALNLMQNQQDQDAVPFIQKSVEFSNQYDGIHSYSSIFGQCLLAKVMMNEDPQQALEIAEEQYSISQVSVDKSAKQYAKHFYFVTLIKLNKTVDYQEFSDDDDITYTDHQLSLEYNYYFFKYEWEQFNYEDAQTYASNFMRILQLEDNKDFNDIEIFLQFLDLIGVDIDNIDVYDQQSIYLALFELTMDPDVQVYHQDLLYYQIFYQYYYDKELMNTEEKELEDLIDTFFEEHQEQDIKLFISKVGKIIYFFQQKQESEYVKYLVDNLITIMELQLLIEHDDEIEEKLNLYKKLK